MPPKAHKAANIKSEHRGGENSTVKHETGKHAQPGKPGSLGGKTSKQLDTGKSGSGKKTSMTSTKASKRSSRVMDHAGRRKSRSNSGPDTRLLSPSDLLDPFLGLDLDLDAEPVIAAPTTVRIKGKRAFRKYIHDSGIKLAVVRSIVALYEETNKPNDALAYICKVMGAGIPTEADVKELQGKIEALRIEQEEVEAGIETMRAQIQARKPTSVATPVIDPEWEKLFDTFQMPSVSVYGLKETPEGEDPGEWAEEDTGSNEQSGNESEDDITEEM